MLESMQHQSACDLVLFGTLGDLCCRKLLPALYQLELAGLMHADSRIIGCAREPLSLSDYRDFVRCKLEHVTGPGLDDDTWQRLSARLYYCVLDLAEIPSYAALKNSINSTERAAIFYFAIPPSLYASVCQGLAASGLNQPLARVVLEKPIGDDLATSQVINNMVATYFTEEQIYRIDHYLGKETVLNLLVLRFANLIFSANWNYQVIDRVEITVAEETGVAGRWDYYDKSGQVRDMLQNHLLQILALIAMEPPIDLSAESIRQEKLKVLKSLRFIDPSNVNTHSLRAQYASNSEFPAYLDEEGARANSTTETLVAVKTYIDNWRWSKVPFFLLTGKRLARKQSEVVIYFKQQPHNIFTHLKTQLMPNQLIIRLQPDEGIDIKIMSKVPGLSQQLELHNTNLDLSFTKGTRIVDAYERLLLEIMQGNQYLFVSREEIECAWRWIDSIKDSWKSTDAPLHLYPAGSWGPRELVNLFDGHAHLWEHYHAHS